MQERPLNGVKIGNAIANWLSQLMGGWASIEAAKNPSHNYSYTYDYGGEKSFNVIWVLVIVLGIGFIYLLIDRKKK